MKIHPRTLLDVRNDIVRVKGNIKAIHGNLFTDEDRELLIPLYEKQLKKLKKEEAHFRTYMMDKINSIN